MDKLEEFNNIVVKNVDNKYIVDEFIRYYKYIYSGYATSEKSSKENYYKLLTIKRIIDLISKYKKKIISGDELGNIKGIGAKTIAKVNEIIKTGKLSEIKDIKDRYESVSELAKIHGIGPSKASFLYEKYKIKSPAELLLAATSGKIKLTHQMELGLKYKDTLVEKIPHELISYSEEFIINKIKSTDKNIIANICGSYRRKKEFSSDMDILISHNNLFKKKDSEKYILDVINSIDNIFIIDKLTESPKTHFQGYASFKNIPQINNYNQKPFFDIENSVIRLDIIIVPISSYYTALMHFTGSATFNQKMRLHAKSLNMKLSEYGLYKYEKNQYKQLEINSEHDIFRNMLLTYIPPEKR